MKKANLVLSKNPSWLLLFCAFILPGCAPTLSPATPPENYKGPVAEGPVLRPSDYWIYERGDRRKTKVGAGTFLGNPRFPLWVGKTWSYQGEALRAGQPQTSQASRLTTDIQCYVAGYGKITVAAGTFEAFECQCACTIYSSRYLPECGEWSFWYAPEVKNIIKIKAESADASVELLEYKLADRAVR
jgi:hypothetical protein